MPDLFANLSAFVVFLGIAAAGFLFLLISLVFGEVFEHLGADVGHEFDHGGPSFFSGRIMSVFITAFGGFGAVATNYGLSVLASSGVGFISGAIFAWLIYLFAGFLYGQQATTQVLATDMMGRVARVVVAIPVNAVGQVRIQVGDEMIDKVARSKDGAAIAENSAVVVDLVLGGLVIVKPQ